MDESSLGNEITTPNGQTRLTPDRVDVSDWGNRGASGRWSRAWGSRFTSDVLVAYSEYFSEAALDVASTRFARGFREDNEVTDFTVRLDNTWRPFQASDIGFGFQFTDTEVAYSFQRLQGDSVRGGLDMGGMGALTSAYAQHRWLPSDRFNLTVGVRASSYDQTESLYWEPRTSIHFKLTDRVSLKGAWGRYYQFVKRIENEDVLEGSRDFWVLAGERLDPLFAEHRIVGASWEDDDYLFDVEAYQKDLTGVSQFSTRSRRRPGQALRDLFFTGTGEARGIEFLAQKKQGRLTGWIGYTLADIDYELEGFNDGNPFPASHDQQHEFKTVASYQAGLWTLSGTWVYGSGRPYTIPEAQYPIELLDGRMLSYIHVGEKNSQRLPAYHRMDVAATRRFESDRFFYELNLSLFNAYGRNNRIVGASWEDDDYLFDVEAYQKDLTGVSQFSTRSRRRPGQALRDLFFTGTGEARGIEFLAQKKQGRLTGWIGYTLADIDYELEGFNDGNPFPASHDQQHEFKTVASYQAGLWTLSGTWVYGSGRPYTIPEAQYPIELLDGRMLSYIHVGEKNSQRLPAYHRMDVAATRRFESDRFFYELNLSLFNAYGRNNIWYRQFDLDELPMIVTDVKTLGFTPSIGLRVGLR